MKYELTGPQEVKVDEKSRFCLPAKMLDILKRYATPEELAESKNGLSVVVGVSLEMQPSIFPKSVFASKVEKEVDAYDPKDFELQELKNLVLGFAEEQQVDSVNRVRIPKVIANHFKLSDTIVVTNAGDHLQMFNRDELSGKLSRLEKLIQRHRSGGRTT
ncbi:MAG: hypothetical protein SFY68_02585 [Candidatus Sumerlaeia bacterium]|nr:hypothetical protein [Candidatus Sumerlaeia bacterium]